VSTSAVNYLIEGPPQAPPLLLIHPLGANLQIWQPLMPELRQHFRVIRYDQRGHGASPVPAGPYSIEALAGDALSLLDRLNIPRAHVCGTSLGGMVALWLAVHAQARVDRLALICTAAQLGPAEGWRERAALVRAQGTQAVAQTAVSRWFSSGFAAREPQRVAQLVRMVEDTPDEGYAASCEAIAGWDIRAELTQIAAPTWIAAGAEDPATPPAHAYAMAAAIPRVRVDVITGAAHLALAERPALVGRLLLDHLQGTAIPGPDPDPERAQRGELVRRAVLGDAHVDRAKAKTTDFTAPFQDFITRYAWGEIWSRPGLSRAERSLVTLSVLAALQHEDELAMHVRAALRNGLEVEQIQEVLLQVGLYAGVPTANRAFAVAQRSLQEFAAAEANGEPKP
jgi:3-oxoadipate enol-lactonase / 4-carboxymuconolactone decarboxylase